MDDLKLVRALKALADKSRFQMVRQISGAGELSCGEVGEWFDLKQPTISHHLKILVDAEILCIRRQGQHALISVNQQTLDEVASLLPRRLTSRPRPAQTRSSKKRRGKIAPRRS